MLPKNLTQSQLRPVRRVQAENSKSYNLKRIQSGRSAASKHPSVNKRNDPNFWSQKAKEDSILEMISGNSAGRQSNLRMTVAEKLQANNSILMYDKEDIDLNRKANREMNKMDNIYFGGSVHPNNDEEMDRLVKLQKVRPSHRRKSPTRTWCSTRSGSENSSEKSRSGETSSSKKRTGSESSERTSCSRGEKKKKTADCSGRSSRRPRSRGVKQPVREPAAGRQPQKAHSRCGERHARARS